MQIINSFKKIFLIFVSILFTNAAAFGLILQKTPVALDAPWGMAWIDDSQILITQKSGEIYLVDTNNYSQKEISHSIPAVQYGQGGLLDIIAEDKFVWVTCSIEKNGKHTTAIYRAELSGNSLINEQLIYEAFPYIESPYHFGSRLEIKGDYLYASIGERGEGMIAQDPSNSIGTIIRIHKNGDIPVDNPYVNNPDWLPENISNWGEKPPGNEPRPGIPRCLYF
jgi:glucose/arabinose dehydrogenase